MTKQNLLDNSSSYFTCYLCVLRWSIV